MAAGVRIIEDNRTYGIASTNTTYCASVFAAQRGVVDGPNRCTDIKSFIKKSTKSEFINVGDSIGYFDALNILEGTTNFTYVRAAHNPKYGGAYIRVAGAVKVNGSLDEGFLSPSDYDLDTQDGRPLIGLTLFKVDKDVSVTNIVVNESFYEYCKTGDKCSFSTEGADATLPDIVTFDVPPQEGVEQTGTEGTLQKETEYYIYKDPDEYYNICIAKTMKDIEDFNFIEFRSNGTGHMLINNTSIESEDREEQKCLLFYDSSPGDFSVSVKISPYRGEEVIESFADNKIGTKQHWSNGETVRFVSSGTLPEGIQPYINYYMYHSEDGYHLVEKYSDAIGNITPEFMTFGNKYKGTVRIIPTDVACKDKDCFVVSVYTDKSRDVPVESFTCSRTPGKKDSLGQNTYIEDVLKTSFYIRCRDNVSVPQDVMPQAQSYHLYLSGGSAGDPVTESDMIRAAQVLSNPAKVPLTLISDAGWATPQFQNTLINICEKRRDCFAVLSVPYDLVRNNNPNAVEDCINYRRGYSTTAGLKSSRFAAMYAPWLLITDLYNDRKIYVPPAGLVVGTMAKNALNYELWYIHAGSKRGRLAVEGVSTAFQYTLAGDGEIALLEDNQINPIIKQATGQIDIWGNQTLEATYSDTSYIHTSLSLITIQPYIIDYLRNNWTFEFQTDQNLQDIELGINSYLNPLKTRLAVEQFSVSVNSLATGGNTMSTEIEVSVATVHVAWIKNITYRHLISRSLDNSISVSSATVTAS